jgi:hypothetical protein
MAGSTNRQRDHAVGLRERAGWQIVVYRCAALGKCDPLTVAPVPACMQTVPRDLRRGQCSLAALLDRLRT